MLFPDQQTPSLQDEWNEEWRNKDKNDKNAIFSFCRLVSGSKNGRDCLSGMPSPPYSFLQVMCAPLLSDPGVPGVWSMGPVLSH